MKYVVIKSSWPIDSMYGNLIEGTIHQIIDPPFGFKKDPNSVFVMGVGRPVRIYEDEFYICERPVNAEDIENSKKIFEKSLQDSKNSIKFVSSNNSLKNRKMAKKEEREIRSLTKTENAVMKSICENLKAKYDDKKVIGKEVTLSELESGLPGIDVPKVCRKLHREDLVTYRWEEDRSRKVAITEKGFECLQLPVKVKEPKSPKEEGESKGKSKKTEKAKSKEGGKPAKNEKTSEDDLLGGENEDPGVEVKSNPVSKLFTVHIDGVKYIYKSKDIEEFRALKTAKGEDWRGMLEDGLLTKA